MRILFLSHYFPPEVNAPASRTFEHCREWAERGHQVSVVTCVPNHPAGRVYPGYRNGLVQTESVAGIKVYRLLTYLAPNRGFTRRSLNYILYLFMCIFAAPFLPRTDVVISTSPQFFCGFAGYLVSRIKRVPWVLEIRDLWPESIVAVGAMGKSLTIRVLEWLAVFAYRKADRIVCVTDSFKDHIVEHGISPDKVTVIKNGVDLDFFNPERVTSDAGKSLGLRGKFVVSYVGTHGMAHGLDTILEAAELLRDDPRVAFLLVGDGAERQRLLNKREMMRLQNVVMLEQQPKDRMPLIWSATAVSLVLLREQPLFHTVIPSKIFESMAMEKPIILGVRGESQRLVEDAGAGICISPESALQLAAAVRRLRSDDSLRNNMGRSGRRYVRDHFDRRMLAQRFEDLLKGLVATREAATSAVRDN